jgi:hypothetical protein
MIIHGAMTDLTGEELVTEETIRGFNEMAGKKISMAYFSNHWFNGIKFPRAMATAARNQRTMPWIRMCPWVDWERQGKYNLFSIIDGAFDNELRQWGVDARAFGSKMVVEFGVEQNGNWFPWSRNISPDKFKSAYRHIINTVNTPNIEWAIHLDVEGDKPFKDYDMAEASWFGVSAYGEESQRGAMKAVTSKYNELVALGDGTKKYAVLEWSLGKEWDTRSFLQSLIDNNFPKISLVSVWNERTQGEIDRRINSTFTNLAAYRNLIANSIFV